MTSEVGFNLGNLPAHVRNPKSQAMQAMAGGLSGGGFGNRISLRGIKFRLVQNGADMPPLAESYLDVVIFAMAPSVQRIYYEGAYEQGSKEAPTCFSHDGKKPSDESTKKQSVACATCPQNVKGSGRQGNAKACAYKKRVVVVSPDDIEGDAYALDVNGQSMFGEQQESANKFSFKGYFEKLSLHGVDIAAIVTRLSFDDNASVPKLHFTPMRALTEEEYGQVQVRMEDEEVQKMLKDLTNEAEVEQFEAAPKPTPPAPKVEPAPAPAPQKGVGGLVGDAAAPKRGFGAKTVTAAPAKPAAPAAVKAPLTIDIEALTNFDDA